MAIDYDGLIYPQLITSIEDTVGSQLATITSPEGSYPAVIRKRTDGAKPPLNYITVDIEHTRLPSGWLLNTEVEHLTETVITTHHVLYEIFVCFECYGDESTSILQQYLSEYSVPDGVRNQLKSQAGLSSHVLGQVKSIPHFISTNYEERAKLDISYYIHDVIVRESTYVESINGSGLLVDADGNTIKSFDISAP